MKSNFKIWCALLFKDENVLSVLKASVNRYFQEETEKAIDSIPILSPKDKPNPEAITVEAKKEMAADIASLREELKRRLDELDKSTQLLLYRTDRRIDHVHTTMETLCGDLNVKINGLTRHIDNHATNVAGTKLDDYYHAYSAAGRSTANRRH